MQLGRVFYELYQSDFQLLEARAWAVPHELQGQLRLEFLDAGPIYVSALRYRDGFCAHYRGGSHFADPLPLERDVSDHPLWIPLIGSSIIFDLLDDLRQVVTIRSPTRLVYCWSRKAGSSEAHHLTVCRSLPRRTAS